MLELARSGAKLNGVVSFHGGLDALDPTDGEAWLILGAAYQEKGDMKNARRSYKACLEQGKRGPKYECAAMPH